MPDQAGDELDARLTIDRWLSIASELLQNQDQYSEPPGKDSAERPTER
jgi:hypothetical protein